MLMNTGSPAAWADAKRKMARMSKAFLICKVNNLDWNLADASEKTKLIGYEN